MMHHQGENPKYISSLLTRICKPYSKVHVYANEYNVYPKFISHINQRLPVS